MAEIRHELSWSSSRRRLFEECRRAYYYQYYGSWRGWEESVSPQVRRAWQLKNLTNLDILAGVSVHEAIGRFFEERRRGETLTREALAEHALERMREAWRQSREGTWESDPKRIARLHEHQYDGDLSKARTDRIRAKVLRCLETFFELPTLAPIREADPEDILLVEDTGGFSVDERTVHAIPDLVLRRGEEVLLVDWKSGRPSPSDPLQMAVYGLFAGERLRARPPRVRGLLAYLGESHLQEPPLDDAALEEALATIRSSLAAMAALHFDPDRESRPLEGFPMDGYPTSCRRCNFRELCGV